MVTGVSSMRRNKLKPVITKPKTEPVVDDEAEEPLSTTPTAKEARIAERLMCPRAPRKHRSEKLIYGGGGAVREYFVVPDLESVFVLRASVQSAN